MIFDLLHRTTYEQLRLLIEYYTTSISTTYYTSATLLIVDNERGMK